MGVASGVVVKARLRNDSNEDHVHRNRNSTEPYKTWLALAISRATKIDIEVRSK